MCILPQFLKTENKSREKNLQQEENSDGGGANPNMSAEVAQCFPLNPEPVGHWPTCAPGFAP